jgi:hypothetical protein
MFIFVRNIKDTWHIEGQNEKNEKWTVSILALMDSNLKPAIIWRVSSTGPNRADSRELETNFKIG